MESPEEEHESFKQRILALHLPEKQEQKLLKECDRLAKMPSGSHEGKCGSQLLGNLFGIALESIRQSYH